MINKNIFNLFDDPDFESLAQIRTRPFPVTKILRGQTPTGEESSQKAKQLERSTIERPILFGMRIHIETLHPRYKLPPDVPPGTGCTRSEFEEWSKRVCGYQAPLLADMAVFQSHLGLHMNANTFACIKLKGSTP